MKNQIVELLKKIALTCIEQKNWTDLGYHVTILSKRRGAFRTTVTHLVQLTMETLLKIEDEEIRINLINVVREVTEGKIFVEVERAKATSILVDYLEKQGKLEIANNLLNDLRLEVLTTMEPVERISMMLKQFRLCLQCKDQLRASLCAEKLKDAKIPTKEHQIQFLDYSIQFHSEFTSDYLAIGKCFYERFKLVEENPNDLIEAIFAAVLAPHSNEQTRFLNDLSNLKILALRPNAKILLTGFMGNELLLFEDIAKPFEEHLNEEKESLLRRRVIEHGLRVIAKFYTNIRLGRLAELLHLEINELEERIIDLVFNEDFYAKIDRPKGIVTFKKQQKVSEVADSFSEDIMTICRLVDHAHSLIEKEKQCIHRLKV